MHWNVSEIKAGGTLVWYFTPSLLYMNCFLCKSGYCPMECYQDPCRFCILNWLRPDLNWEKKKMLAVCHFSLVHTLREAVYQSQNWQWIPQNVMVTGCLTALLQEMAKPWGVLVPSLHALCQQPPTSKDKLHSSSSKWLFSWLCSIKEVWSSTCCIQWVKWSPLISCSSEELWERKVL